MPHDYDSNGNKTFYFREQDENNFLSFSKIRPENDVINYEGFSVKNFFKGPTDICGAESWIWMSYSNEFR